MGNHIDFELLHHCLIKHNELMNRLKEVDRLPSYVDVPDFSKALAEEFGEALEVFILIYEFDNIMKFLMKRFGRVLAESKYHWWRGDDSRPDKYELLLEVGDMLHFVFSIALKSALHISFPYTDTIFFLCNQIRDDNQPMALFFSTISNIIRDGYMNYYDLLVILKTVSEMFDLNINDMLIAYLVKNKVNMIRIENNWDKSKDPNAKEMLDKALRGEEPIIIDYHT